MPSTSAGKTIFWHRELPPLDAELVGEDVLESTSDPVPNTFSHRDEVWDTCYASLMANTTTRLALELARRTCHFAHVLDESIDVRRNDANGTAWLHGQFRYVLYRSPGTADAARLRPSRPPL